MQYSVNYFELAEKINTVLFSRYLKDTGWEQFPSRNTKVKIYQYENAKGFYQVNLPVDKTLSDYKEAMYRAVQTVAEAENRELQSVLLYLLNPCSDILKIRMANPNVESGNIPLDDAIRVYDNTKKLLAAAAQDVLHPRKYHQGRMEDAVSKFLSECRFGQTEVGSYVVSVVCPFVELGEQEKYKQLSIFSDGEECANSLTRKVTSRVMENLYQIKKNVDEDNMEELVSQTEKCIISSNFYEALMNLNENPEGTDVKFMAEWSPTVRNEQCPHSHILFSHDYYEPIRVTVNRLRKEKATATKIYGRIKQLDSTPDVTKRKEGKITVVYLDENNRPKTIIVRVDKNDYDKAIMAHSRGYFIEVIGKMIKGANRKAFMECEALQIIDL